jgi:hypothetical protein
MALMLALSLSAGAGVRDRTDTVFDRATVSQARHCGPRHGDC